MTHTSRRYLSTSIPYVNSEPHVGFALELVQADALARFRRSKGDEVWLQGGTDDNSLKNVRSAEEAGLPVAELVARNAGRFQALAETLGVTFSDYVCTSRDPRHRPTVERLWRACAEAGDIYRKSYEGLYCVGCEQFYTESELVDGCCTEHGTTPETVKEENWFFRLSRYTNQLLGLVESREIDISPDHKRNEIIGLLRQGLADISISRSAVRAKGWGIPVPDDPSEVVYVWIDALANYLSGLGFGGSSGDFDRWWSSAGHREHLVGKGITRFHAVYWPAILLSAGLPLPSRILVHGYVTLDGRKIGKSNGNGIDPEPLVERYGRDAVRWYLLRHIRSDNDGDFS
jgi:methionyl-tRNA synthetase